MYMWDEIPQTCIYLLWSLPLQLWSISRLTLRMNCCFRQWSICSERTNNRHLQRWSFVQSVSGVLGHKQEMSSTTTTPKAQGPLWKSTEQKRGETEKDPSKGASSGHGRTVRLMNSQQLWLPAQDQTGHHPNWKGRGSWVPISNQLTAQQGGRVSLL